MENNQKNKSTILNLLNEGNLSIQEIPIEFKNDSIFMFELWEMIKENFPEKDYTFSTLTNIFINNIGENLTPYFSVINKQLGIEELVTNIDICFNNIMLQNEVSNSTVTKLKKVKI